MTRKIDWSQAASLPPDELNRLLEDDHDEVDDNPPATAEQLATARPGTLRPGQRGPGKRPAKVPLTVRVEPAALAAWKASGAGWQSRINDLVVREAPKTKRSA